MEDCMLVLTRRQGESICVGDGIVITVLSTENGRARIGIEAPRNVQIDRTEVREKKRAQEERLFAAH
jgi:carbon storage regulator